MNREYQKQSYKTLFAILDDLYTKNKNDFIGILLGSMNSDLFLGSDSADPAVFEDFCACQWNNQINHYNNKSKH